MPSRAGEEDKTHFRSERFENINGQWFFRIREKQGLTGPYQSQQMARRASEAYIKDIKKGVSEISGSSYRYVEQVFSMR